MGFYLNKHYFIRIFHFTCNINSNKMADKAAKDTKEASKKKADPPQQASDLGSLEEDDEFEEFPAEEWDAADKEPEIYWEENWDDDNIEDDFSNQLRAVLEGSNKN